MIYRISLIILAFSIVLGLYPNVFFLKFGVYTLDIAVILVFIQSGFLLKYRIKWLDIFIFSFFLLNFIFLLLNTKFLVSFSSLIYLLRFCIYLSCYPFFKYISKKIPAFSLKTYILFVYITLLLNLIIFLLFPDLSVFGFDPHKFRLYGQFLDPNYYSVFVCLNLHFILNLSKKYSKFKPLVVFVLVLSVFLTFSRLGLLCLFLVTLLNLNKKYLPYFALFFVVGFLGVLSNNTFLNRLLFLEGNMDSFLYRIFDFLDGVNIYKNSVIPSGFNNMQIYNNSLTSNVNNSSSYYDFWPLNIVLSGGVLLVGLISLFLIYVRTNSGLNVLNKGFFVLLFASLGMNVLFYPVFMLYAAGIIGINLNSKSKLI